MKKTILVLATMFLFTGLYASTDIQVSLFGNKSAETVTISREALSRCNELTLNTKDWKVKSFEIGFVSEGNFTAVKNIENKISDRSMSAIKEHAPSKIYIEKIVIINRSGEQKTLEAFTVKVSD